MLERLKLIFSRQEPETVASLLAARTELEAARAAAIEVLRRAQVEKNSLLVEAVAAGDIKTRATLRKQLAELQAEVDELAGALTGLDARIATARAAEAEQAAAAGRVERAELAQQRETAARDMQKHLSAFCEAYGRFFEVGQRVESKLTRRAIAQRGETDFHLFAAIEQQLVCRSPGNLLGNRDALGLRVPFEFQRDGMLHDLDEHVRRQNGRLLTGDFMTPAPQPAAA